MGMRVNIEGSETVSLLETSITGVRVGADIPLDSNARSTDLGSTVLIEGRQGGPNPRDTETDPAGRTGQTCQIVGYAGAYFTGYREGGPESGAGH